jgi:hypothetical protein
MCKCGATWTGKRLEHCTACHETFTGTSAGDRHRTGAYFPLERRCLTSDEMRAKGMAQNKHGHWGNGGESPWRADSGPHVVRLSDEQASGGRGDQGDVTRAGGGE